MGKFPRNMLFARAMSNGVKWFCPDVFLGVAVYTPDELGAVIDEEGAIIEMQTITIESPIAPPPPECPFDEAQLEADISHAAEVDDVDSTPFESPEKAIAWGIAQGAFGAGPGAGPHARNAYNKLREEVNPETARQMAAVWRQDVARRLAVTPEA